MLPLWRDQVRIVLCKDRVIFLHLQGGARGRRVRSKLIVPCVTSEPGWQPVLAVLESSLQGKDLKKADAMVILSNHFMRFLVLPWNEASLSATEKMALVQHRFSEVYGEGSERWEFRLSEGAYGASSIASAVPRELLQQLKKLLADSPLRLNSVQPYLMMAFNACRRELGKQDGWFVLAERDTYCIGLMRGGQWSSIRVRHAVADWFEEAMLLLEREALLAAGSGEINEVFVCAPESAVVPPAKRGAWQIRRILLNPLPEFSPAEMASYSMAAAGL